MKKNYFNIFLTALMTTILSTSPLCAAEVLTNSEIRQIETKIRHDIQLQSSYIDSSLVKIENDLDNYLFGPQVNNNLLTFYNKRIVPSDTVDQETLWLYFKEEVLNKDKFDQFIDNLIEIHFRVFEKARREVNRDLLTFGLNGLEKINYEDIKRQLKQEINEIWNMETEKIHEILHSSVQQAYDINLYKKIGKYIEISYLITDLAAFMWHPVVAVAGAVVFGGWLVYKHTIAEAKATKSMETSQQQFMRKMTTRLKSLSEQIKEQFKKSSDIAKKMLFDAIRHMIVDAHPQIKVENLQ